MMHVTEERKIGKPIPGRSADVRTSAGRQPPWMKRKEKAPVETEANCSCKLIQQIYRCNVLAKTHDSNCKTGNKKADFGMDQNSCIDRYRLVAAMPGILSYQQKSATAW